MNFNSFFPSDFESAIKFKPAVPQGRFPDSENLPEKSLVFRQVTA